MPTYKVKDVGFHDSHLYDPNGKRRTLTTAKPFTKKNPMPSWLEDMPEESPAVKAKREAQEQSQAAADAQKAKDDAQDIQDASFLGEGESSSAPAERGSAVETI